MMVFKMSADNKTSINLKMFEEETTASTTTFNFELSLLEMI